MSTLDETLSKKEWCIEHEDDLRNLFPETWTNGKNVDAAAILQGFAKMGIIILAEDVNAVFGFIHKIGIIQSDGKGCVRRNPRSIFA